jgi:hypothetical protein
MRVYQPRHQLRVAVKTTGLHLQQNKCGISTHRTNRTREWGGLRSGQGAHEEDKDAEGEEDDGYEGNVGSLVLLPCRLGLLRCPFCVGVCRGRSAGGCRVQAANLQWEKSAQKGVG